LTWLWVLLSASHLARSFVSDVIMPPIGVALGGVNFSNLAIIIQEAVGEAPAVVIAYGKFIQTMVDFTIIAFAVFMAVKVINSMQKKEEEAPRLQQNLLKI
jgi:large conductance mechanosensitive channel